MFNPDKYLSVVWQKGGRVYPALDCFGIVNEVRKDLGLPLWPDFSGVKYVAGAVETQGTVDWSPGASHATCFKCIKGTTGKVMYQL
jgi:hypothetical protein